MPGTFKRFWPHLLCAVLALGLWDTPVLKPFRVFMVLVHEMSHAGAALATGGEVTQVRIHWNESGHAVSRGGFVPLISSAGYVGAALLGALLIFAGSRAGPQRILLAGIGCLSVWMSARYTPFMDLDFIFGVASGALLLILAAGFPRSARWMAAWLGVMLCLYSLYDFRTDLWMHPERTDAGILARYWGLPFLAYPIAFCWAAISIYAMYLAMRAVERRGRRLDAQIRQNEREQIRPVQPEIERLQP